MPKKYRPYRPLSIEDTDVGRKIAKRKYIPKPEKIRQDALNSHDGGRIRCDFCRHTFGAYYVHLTVASWPQEPKPACKDCREARNLRKV
jgi:hypothetical protein